MSQSALSRISGIESIHIRTVTIQIRNLLHSFILIHNLYCRNEIKESILGIQKYFTKVHCFFFLILILYLS